MLAVNTLTKIHSGLLVLQAARTKIAVAAIKIFNIAMNANPIMKVVSAIGLLVGGIALLSKKFSKSGDDSDMLKQHIENVTGSIHSMRDAFDNAKVTLPNYDKLISYKGNTLGDIDEQISQKEALITDAIKNAIKEQKGARDEDIRNIRQYMKDIQGLEEEKLTMYMGVQSAQIGKMANELKYGDFDQQGVADIVASAKEAFDQTTKSIDDAYTARLTNIENWYTAERTAIENNEELTGKARADAQKKVTDEYNKQNKEAFNWKNEQLDIAQGYLDEVNNMAVEKTRELSNNQKGIQKEISDTVGKSKKAFDTFKQGNSVNNFNRGNFSESFNQQLGFYDTLAQKMNTLNSSTINTKNLVGESVDNMSKTFGTFKVVTKKDYADIYNTLLNMDENVAESTHNFLLAANEAKKSGVELSGETQLHLENIITLFENLPPEMQETGALLLAGLMQGMTDENGNVIDTTNMTCQELVDTAREVFDVHSPSRVFAEIGTNIGLGLLQGISLIMPVVTAAITTNMMCLVTSASGFKLDGMGQNAENVSETVVLAFSNMSTVSCQHMSGMQKSVILISKLMSTAVIVNLKTMSVQAVIIVQAMSVSIVSTMNQMKSGIDGLDLYSTGINVMNGLINGMESRRGGLISTAQSIAQTVKNTMNNALDIHSPSRELYKTGVYTGLGQINGMKSTLPQIKDTANKMGETSIPENDKYIPSSSPTTYSKSTTSENHTYAPTFNLTISGTSDDRTMARKVKKWVSEALEETFSSYESKNALVREV